MRITSVAGALALLAFAISQPAGAADVTLVADPGHSLAEFSVLHLGITHVRGSILISQASIVVPMGGMIPP